MESQSLIDFLSVGLPAIPVQGVVPGSNLNTTNAQYSPYDSIDDVVTWAEFNYAAIMQRFGPMLNEIEVQPKHFGTPPSFIRSESGFRFRIAELVLPRIRRALRVGFGHLAPLSQPPLTSVVLKCGTEAMIIDHLQFTPDTTFLSDDPNHPSSVNRAPGYFKVSWKWSASHRDTDHVENKREYYKVMAQMNFTWVKMVLDTPMFLVTLNSSLSSALITMDSQFLSLFHGQGVGLGSSPFS